VSDNFAQSRSHSRKRHKDKKTTLQLLSEILEYSKIEYACYFHAACKRRWSKMISEYSTVHFKFRFLGPRLRGTLTRRCFQLVSMKLPFYYCSICSARKLLSYSVEKLSRIIETRHCYESQVLVVPAICACNCCACDSYFPRTYFFYSFFYVSCCTRTKQRYFSFPNIGTVSLDLNIFKRKF